MKIDEEYKVDLSDELQEISERISKALHTFEDEQIQKALVKLGWITPEQKQRIILLLEEAKEDLEAWNECSPPSKETEEIINKIDLVLNDP